MTKCITLTQVCIHLYIILCIHARLVVSHLCLLRMQLATRFTIYSYPPLDQAHPFSVSLEVID